MTPACVRCHRRKGVVRRRLETSVGTLGIPELVCLKCAGTVDNLMERVWVGAIQVDRAVRGYRERLAA